jgi:carbon storage regulator CsrA
MLVLTRKPQEQIRVGDDVVITILRVKGQSVRIGIEAPPQVSLLRAELSPRQAPGENSRLEIPSAKKRPLTPAKKKSVANELTNTAGKFTNPFAAASPNRLTGASAFAGSEPGLLRQNTSGLDVETSSSPRSLPRVSTR